MRWNGGKLSTREFPARQGGEKEGRFVTAFLVRKEGMKGSYALLGHPHPSFLAISPAERYIPFITRDVVPPAYWPFFIP
jgi:hypothetical protein